MVAGHSLGEFSALVANGVLSFEAALNLVSIRAKAMQRACELNPSTMAAVLALVDDKVEAICQLVQDETGEIVVPANYNCPGQLVISGSIRGIDIACERMKAAGAKRALVLPVGGAFHSQRLRLISSQVGHVAPSRRAGTSHKDRLIMAISLLDDTALDALVSDEIAFDDIAASMPRILNGSAGALAPVIRYTHP